MKTTTRWLALCLLAPLFFVASTAAADCRKDPRYRALDPWLGEWRIVEEVDGKPVARGRTTLSRVAGGCAIEEARHLTDGSEQRSLAVFDHGRGVWLQQWVNSEGDTGRFTIEAKKRIFGITGRIQTINAGELLVRGRVTAREDGGFDESMAFSTDEGKTYSTPTRTRYVPVGAKVEPPEISQMPPTQPPAAPKPTLSPQPAPEPSPEPEVAAPAAPSVQPVPEASRVKLRSRRKSDAPVAETAMESPMTLEVELGPLNAIPAGGSWRTAELAPYVVDSVSMPVVTAAKRQRRGKVRLELIVNLHTSTGQARVDLDAILIATDQEVATARGENIKLGKLIRAHDAATGLPYRLEFELEQEAFEALFADGAKPSVRLTLTTR